MWLMLAMRYMNFLLNGNVNKCGVKKYPKYDFIETSASIAIAAVNSFSGFCQGRRRRSV